MPILYADLAQAARNAGLPCRHDQTAPDERGHGITYAARRFGGDRIVMASHGRRGLPLGSGTRKMLVRSAIPVLLHR